MKITAAKQELAKSLNIVLKAVPSKTTMNILYCVLIDATVDTIKLTGNDMELGIETEVKGTIEERGLICLDAKLFAVKLNRSNLGEEEPQKTANAILERGVQNVLYSAPHERSYIFTGNGSYACDSLAGSLVNVTGTADSMVAGFLYGVIRGADTEESFRYANAASLATCMTNDPGSKEKIEELYDTIQIEKYE